MAGRKRTGTLLNFGGTWRARIAGGALVDLGTTDRPTAERALAKLTGRTAAPVNPEAEIFRDASARVVETLARDGMVTARDRLARLRTYAWPLLGDMPVATVRARDISSVLAAAAAAGLSKQTVKHLRTDLRKVFAELVRDEVLETNPAAGERVRVPRQEKDSRKRTLLTDEEFVRFVSFHIGGAPRPAPVRGNPNWSGHLKVSRRQLALMAFVSRGFGGLRPSDIHAWTWEDIDRVGWEWADAPRAKTEHLAETADREVAPRARITLPPDLAAHLAQWWRDAGSPATGLVFPRQQHSYARPLRAALLEAGITRPELHQDTERSRATDFYSFRRAWATALARVGTNSQTAMALTGHTNPSTHQRYVVPGVLQVPAGVVPAFPDPSDDFEAALESFDPTIKAADLQQAVVAKYARPQRDLNSCYRRERPEVTAAHVVISCQEETDLSSLDGLLRALADLGE